ncbi:arginase family protein [Lichenihabitans sp. Uapishka_5]|uniref:arginase family protein n=1 Tax=Lichenihabitans sp. Uapishka_5 TaxID=3037302 RepID=UPI0029E80D79|nr:arginase family protein [Lichenihabitans sp. Uapishka_5]MDX7953146.1 arginase family protein [Lichenihabitans sp. Uapishka_5]
MVEPTTFIGLKAVSLDDLQAAAVVVLGASEASPYQHGVASHSALGPRLIREASSEFGPSLSQFDFDLDATMFPTEGDDRGMVDAGDIATSPFDPEGNRTRIRDSVTAVLRAGAVPVLLGGDDSVPIPMLQAYENHGPIWILQIDAHVDWGDVIQGNPLGYGSTMRRAADCAWVAGMVQVGIRGLGSGGAWQHDDARRWGSHLVTSYALHRQGIQAVLAPLPAGARCVLCIDLDGLDPSVLPAVAMPTPGGLSYEDVIGLIRGVAAKATIAGLAVVEYVPERDDRFRLSALTAARIAAVTMGCIAASIEAS